MELPIGAIDAALHLAIFLAGAVAVGAFALAVLDRLTSDDVRSIGWRYAIAAAAAFAGLIAVERLFHTFV